MNLRFDLQYAWRLFIKSPIHSLLSVGVVALSIGLATAVYTIAYGAWLKPLDIPGSQRWYVLHEAVKEGAGPWFHNVDPFTYQELLKSNRNVRHLGAVSMRPSVLSEGRASVTLRGYAISPSLLTATRTAPILGRVFSDAQTESQSAPTAILGFEAWQNYFTADPTVIGKQARINGKPTQIIGVMPKGFSLGMWADLWLPLTKGTFTATTDATPLEPFIEMGAAQTRGSVLQEIRAGIKQINLANPARYDSEREVVLAPAHRAWTDIDKGMPTILSVLAIAVVLLGSVNISMLFFARLMERSRELALRSALGESRGRLLRQCLLESSIVMVLGLLLGVSLAYVGSVWLQSAFDAVTETQQYVNAADFVVHDQQVLLAAVAAVGIWLLSTLLPARAIAKQDAAQVLAGNGKGTNATARGGARTAGILVGLQVMVSYLVLVVCANVVLAEMNEIKKPKGVARSQIVVSGTATPFNQDYAAATKRLQYFESLTAAIKSRVSGTEVGFATAVPATDMVAVPIGIEAQEARPARDAPSLRLLSVSENYFDLLGVALRRGRMFNGGDDDSTLDVALIDEVLVKRYWPDQDPIGKRIQLNPRDNGSWLTVVGVVAHVGDMVLGAFDGRVYRPIRQSTPDAFVVIAKPPPTLLASDVQNYAAIKAAAFEVDRDLPLSNVRSLEEYFADAESRGPRHIFGVIAIITAFLAATGLFGLITRTVEQRTQEVGIRRALGATKLRVTALFLRQGFIHLGIGVVLGGGLGIAATTGLTPMYPDILDNLVLITVSVFAAISAVILAASYFPTRRAVALEPGDALRYE